MFLSETLLYERGAAVIERADVAEGKLGLIEHEANNNAIRRAEIDYNNAKLQQDTNIATQNSSMKGKAASVELKRDLALLGLTTSVKNVSVVVRDRAGQYYSS